MTGPTGTIFNMRTKVGNIPCFNILQDSGDTVKITCNDEVHQWITEQEISEWKFEYDVKNYYNAFLLSKELYIMLKLRWE
jgi:hypothetical protein